VSQPGFEPKSTYNQLNRPTPKNEYVLSYCLTVKINASVVLMTLCAISPAFTQWLDLAWVCILTDCSVLLHGVHEKTAP